MHVVTKILIVFCAILSLILAALTMAFATNANAIRKSVGDEQARRVAAETAVASNAQQWAQEKLGWTDVRSGLERSEAAARNEVSKLQAERTDLRARLEAATADAAAIRNQIAQLGATTDTQAALIKAYRDEVTALRGALLTGSKKEIELVDRINDLESAREVLEQSARALKEQLEELKLVNQTLQQNGGVASTTAATNIARELPGPLVRARVVETFRSPAGEDMVVIDEGSNRGLKENISMNITRGDQYIAGIVITAVESNRSVGRVTLGKMPVSRDDVVLSRLN
jgi:stress response protein YsnF